MTFTAHEDDSLLFLSPDLLHAIQSGACVRSVFITAGDDGGGQAYWSGREQGAEAAYANMAGVANSWTSSSAGITGHPMPLQTLNGNPRVSLVFMRLPDGAPDGSGFSSDKFQTLQKLYNDNITSISTVDGSSAYTEGQLISTLTTLISNFTPGTILTQDYVGSFGDGDHSDHHATAYLTQIASRDWTAQAHKLVGYMDYATSGKAANVTGADLTAKENAWFTYAPFDGNVCQTVSACQASSYWAWVNAEYTVGSENDGPSATNGPEIIANAGPDQSVADGATVQLDATGSADPGSSPTYQWTQTGGPAVALSSATSATPTFKAPSTDATLTFKVVVSDGTMTSAQSSITVNATSDIAPLATATASSQNTSTGQLATSAVDGVIDGYPGVATAEWATVGGTAGSWLKLVWPTAHTINRVVLYDRPNTGDQVTGGTLTFSDGTVVTVPSLDNAGGATTVTFPADTTTSVLFTVTSASATTANVGLAEIQVYPTTATSSGAPTANAGANQSVAVNSQVQLDGSVSTDPNGSPSYQWTQIGGPPVTLSSASSVKPTFTAPASPGALTFQLVVTDGPSTSTPATVTITVTGLTPTAAAGPNQSVAIGSQVQLDGSGSTDPNGAPKYVWTQTAGPAVTLSSSTVVKPTFAAPSTDATLTFQLVVSDAGQVSAASAVTIKVISDIAELSTATASSQNTSTGQLATNAVDGIIDGYPGNYAAEWATNGGTAGSWLKLVWSSAQTINKVVLYDRPNSTDQVTGGTLTFSDGTVVSVPALNNDGTATTVTFPDHSTTSILFTVTSVSATTQNVGLAEIQVYPDTAGGSGTPGAPTANAGSSQLVAAGATVSLDGSGSTDPGGHPTYKWTQTGGPTVTLSSTTAISPTFTAPSTNATLTFTLVLSDGTQSSQASTVGISVTTDLAELATASASSEATANSQTAGKAIDGVIDGYPGDYTKEWATNGGGASSWLKLSWSSAHTISRVVLYDRPNPNDQIAGGTLTFSDGSTVSVPSLNNDGTATTVTFPAKTTTSLLLTVTSVSATTQNVGLSEIQAFAS